VGLLVTADSCFSGFGMLSLEEISNSCLDIAVDTLSSCSYRQALSTARFCRVGLLVTADSCLSGFGMLSLEEISNSCLDIAVDTLSSCSLCTCSLAISAC